MDPKTQEDVRRRVIRMLQKGLTQQSAADELEVSRTWVNGWRKRFQERGWEALPPCSEARAEKEEPQAHR